MSPRKQPRPVAALAVVVGLLPALGACGSPGGDQTEAVSASDGEVHGPWTVLYSGYGRVLISDEEVVLEPRSANSLDVTHGALVHTTQSCLDADFEVTVRTEEQVRQDSPNPWEVGWVLWNFRDDEHFYALALKPGGWEISKQDPAYPGNQRFLTSGTERVFPLGEDYRVQVSYDWPRMTVTVDGEELSTVVDDESPYRDGAIGLYTEDARVHFTDFELSECGETR